MLFHAIFLTLSTVVILLAFFLRTEGETVVTIPFLDAPLPPLCLFQHFTGFDCPGCGLTRCFISVAHGRFQNAWYYNPGGIALFFFVAAQIPYRAVQIVRIRRGLPELSVARVQWIISIVVVLMFFPWLWKTASRLLGWV